VTFEILLLHFYDSFDATRSLDSALWCIATELRVERYYTALAYASFHFNAILHFAIGYVGRISFDDCIQCIITLLFELRLLCAVETILALL
jgi:small basic protein